MQTSQNIPARAWWSLAILAIIYATAFVDRAVMGIVAEPMRRDLGFTDTQLGLLTGFAFTLLYALAGLPLGRLVDRTSRKPIIAAGIVVWSVMTAMCGIAGSFGLMFAARLGVGLGEATLNPAAGSLLADSFPAERLGRIMAVYTLGGFVGGGLALMGGGALLGHFGAGRIELPVIGMIAGWQMLFLVLGGCSLALVLLVLTIREPARQSRGPGAPAPAIGEVWRFFRANGRALTAIFGGIACLAAIFAASQAWVPSMLARRFGFTPADAAFWFGLSFATAGTLGNFAGGVLVDWLRARGRTDAGACAGLIVTALLPALAIAFALAEQRALALVLLWPLAFAAGMAFSIGPPALQVMTPGRMRGQVFALYLLTASLIGFGGGPVLSAVLGQRLFAGPLALAHGFATAAAIAGTGAGVLLLRGIGRFPVMTRPD